MKQTEYASLVRRSVIRATALSNAPAVNSGSLYTAASVWHLVCLDIMKRRTTLVRLAIPLARRVVDPMTTTASLAQTHFQSPMEHVFKIVQLALGVMALLVEDSVYRARLAAKPVRWMPAS